MALGEKVKKLRKGKGLSQETMAQQVGINSKHLSRVERGLFHFSVEVLKSFAQTLGVSVDFLLSETDEQIGKVRIENKNVAERNRLIDQLDSEHRQAIIRVVDSMLTKHKMRRLLQEEPLEARG